MAKELETRTNLCFSTSSTVVFNGNNIFLIKFKTRSAEHCQLELTYLAFDTHDKVPG